MVLRPAEVAILTLICAGYAIQPLNAYIGFDNLNEVQRQHFFKIIAVLLLGKYNVVIVLAARDYVQSILSSMCGSCD